MKPRMPSRNDNRNDKRALCPACGELFARTGRQKWCSDRCRQVGWRRHHPASASTAAAAALPPPRPKRAGTVYLCPALRHPLPGRTVLQRLQHVLLPGRAGGYCPNCDEPVAINDLITVTT